MYYCPVLPLELSWCQWLFSLAVTGFTVSSFKKPSCLNPLFRLWLPVSSKLPGKCLTDIKEPDMVLYLKCLDRANDQCSFQYELKATINKLCYLSVITAVMLLYSK